MNYQTTPFVTAREENTLAGPSHATTKRAAGRVMFLLAASAMVLAAGDKHFVSLGYTTSPVLQSLKANRKVVDGRALLESAKKSARDGRAPMIAKDPRTAEKSAFKAQLRNADALGADLSEFDPSDDDLLMVEAAHEAGVPVILENVTKEKMALFFGVGVDNSLVIAEFDPHLRSGRLNFGEPMQSPEGVTETPETLSRRTFAHRLQLAQDILENRPYTRGVRAQSAAQPAYSDGTIGNCTSTNASGQPYFASAACFEWSSTGLGPIQYCPYMTDTTWGVCVYGKVNIDPEFAIGIYQVGTKKYILMRALGGWGRDSVAPLTTTRERFPFFTSYEVKFVPILSPVNPVWSISHAAPANPNNASSITVTTGWSVSGGGSAGTDSASVNASATYSSSSATTSTLSDWSVKTNSSGAIADWTYYMSSSTQCDGTSKTAIGPYDKPGDKMVNFCTSAQNNQVDTPPGWSFDGYANSGTPLSEAVWWSSSPQLAPTVVISYTVKAIVYDLKITKDKWIFGADWSSESTTENQTIPIAVSTSVVHN